MADVSLLDVLKQRLDRYLGYFILDSYIKHELVLGDLNQWSTTFLACGRGDGSVQVAGLCTQSSICVISRREWSFTCEHKHLPFVRMERCLPVHAPAACMNGATCASASARCLCKWSYSCQHKHPPLMRPSSEPSAA